MATLERIRTINDYASQLSEFEQNELIENLRKQVLKAKARVLDASVLPNSIAMEEIVKEVRQYRKAKNHAGSN